MFLGLMDLLFLHFLSNIKAANTVNTISARTFQHFQRKKVLGYIRSKLFLFIALLQTYE